MKWRMPKESNNRRWLLVDHNDVPLVMIFRWEENNPWMLSNQGPLSFLMKGDMSFEKLDDCKTYVENVVTEWSKSLTE